MATINKETREAQFKIVYCGTPMSGKTTNLIQIHERMGGIKKGELVSLATAAERTLFFDFLPMTPVEIGGYQCRFHLYTVPGQITFNATLELVLRGADGIVFVADSTPDRAQDNIRALRNLESNLKLTKRSLLNLPVVLQYNKRDVPEALSLDTLQASMNHPSKPLPHIEAVAASGTNVFETLNYICGMVLRRFEEMVSGGSGKKGSPVAPVEGPGHPSSQSKAASTAGISGDY
jgi:signal recognition particle receptor subunit beta